MISVPSEAPKNLACGPESTTSISLTWDILEPNKWNGAEKGYMIEYVKYQLNSNNYSIARFRSDERSGYLTGLDPFTRYEIYIRAETRVGFGPRSWCVQSTQEGGK